MGIDEKKEERKLILLIFVFIIGIACLNLVGMLAPTWLFIATILGITLFIYENFSKSVKLEHIFLLL
ncbi:hypothetical protein EVU96_12610 [Bacillus infantis]|uniref:hypothetical protein n=1 Tax=Bacillus infantis TaxID=324767 RepID=UPI00101CBCD8|nr:hypothetical protein [Bacillus infantis]RYI28769.1 hypothetical protein EVU96_12610 [Bacillus infantis]